MSYSAGLKEETFELKHDSAMLRRNTPVAVPPIRLVSKIALVIIRPVKRFCLILLIMLLPIQMSWAAMHICDDDIAVADTSAQVMHQSAPHEHDHQVLKADQGDTGKAHAADACCFAGHGCHSLHSLMVSDSSQPSVADRAHALNGRHSQLAGGAFSARHERPKWPAA